MKALHPPFRSCNTRATWLPLLVIFFLLAVMPAFAQSGLPCNNPDCTTTSIIVNTGFNHNTGAVYPTGVQDEFWTITADPDATNGSVPRPANTVPRSVMFWSLPQVKTQWIAGTTTSANTFLGSVTYERCFCVCGTSPTNLTFNLGLMSDDSSSVFVDGTFIGGVSGLLMVVTTVNSTLPLTPGVHCIRIIVHNQVAGDAGLNVQGTITGTGLLKPKCCGRSEDVTPDEDCDVESLILGSNSSWTVRADPQSPGPVLRCADSVTIPWGWNPPQLFSEWISLNSTGMAVMNGISTFQKCFCVSEVTTLQLRVSAMADDEIEVIFGGTTIIPPTSGTAFGPGVPVIVTIPITIDRGCHCMQFKVRNIHPPPPGQLQSSGLNAVIRLTGQNLLRDSCCYCAKCPCEADEIGMPSPPDNPGHSDHGARVESNTRTATRSMLMSVPNPTTGETTFHYVVDRGTDVTLELYNATGERVEVLETGWKGKGNHSLPYNAQKLPAGMYHLRMKFGSDTFSLPVNVQ